MGSLLSWTANGVLFVLGCFLAAETVNEIIASTLLAPSPEVHVSAPTAAAVGTRNWADRQAILDRNLFNSSTLQASVDVAEAEEELEKSKLPVTLLGTFAASDPGLSRATLRDKEANDTFVVGVGDQIKNKALVTRIERRRVVLSENGLPRELTLEDDGKPKARPVRSARARPPRVRPRQTVTRNQVQQNLRNPASLLSQARILPKFEDGEMVGLQVSGIKSGSLFEELGMQDGDVITEFNGIPIDSPDESVKILQELSEADELNVAGYSKDGTEWNKDLNVDE
ncbi:MAG: type II secretion system protein N [Myxococcota bacterium]